MSTMTAPSRITPATVFAARKSASATSGGSKTSGGVATGTPTLPAAPTGAIPMAEIIGHIEVRPNSFAFITPAEMNKALILMALNFMRQRCGSSEFATVQLAREAAHITKHDDLVELLQSDSISKIRHGLVRHLIESNRTRWTQQIRDAVVERFAAARRIAEIEEGVRIARQREAERLEAARKGVTVIVTGEELDYLDATWRDRRIKAIEAERQHLWEALATDTAREKAYANLKRQGLAAAHFKAPMPHSPSDEELQARARVNTIVFGAVCRTVAWRTVRAAK